MELEAAIKSFVAGYFSTCRRSLKTREAYCLDLKQFAENIGNSPIGSVTADSIERWAEELKSRRYAVASIRRKFAAVRVFFSFWVRRGTLATSPLWKIRLDLGRQKDLPRNLSATDTKLIIEKAWERTTLSGGQIDSPKDKRFLAIRDLAAIEVLFATGLRVGELVSLNISNWREDEASFSVKGKGSKQRLAFLTDKRSITATTEYIKLRRSLFVSDDSLFINARGSRLSTQGISRTLSLISVLAKVDKHVTPHMIRHTVATLLLRHGADIRVVQEVLGHASIVTTQRYTHVSKEHLLETLRAYHPNHHLKITSAVVLP